VPTELALEAVGVSKRYGDHSALCDVSLRAEAGRIHGLLGPNGAGKTTLMRIVLGLVRRDSGTVRLLGRDLNPASEQTPDGVAAFVEGAGFYPYLTGRRTLALLARLDDTDERDARVSTAIDRVGLGRYADVRVAAYSAGTRQRLGLAAALVRSPRVLLLDEPTSSLDPAGGREMRDLMRERAGAGVAVILSSHDMTEVEELCDSASILHHGRIIFSGAIEQLKTRAEDTVHALRTSDDDAALSVAATCRDVTVSWAADRAGLEATGRQNALDAYIIALGSAGVAIRALEPRERSLADIFLQLTGVAPEQ